MTKIVRLTTRPSSAGGQYEGYEKWLNKWITVLENAQPFTAATITGRTSDYLYSTGRMSWSGSVGEAWSKAILSEGIRDNITYVIRSYDTPIAMWVERIIGDVEGFWIMPNLTYSNTTSRHQSKIGLILNHYLPDHVVTTLDDLNKLVGSK